MQVPAFFRTATENTQGLTLDIMIDTVLGGYQCPDNLLNRDKEVASFYDRYEKTMERHEELKSLVHSDSKSEDLRKELENFFRGFMTRNKCPTLKDTWEAAAVATLIRMAGMGMAARLDVSKALLFGSGLSGGRLEEAASRIENGGEMGDRAAVAADLSDINFVGILGVATALICSCDADSGQADSAVRSVTALDLQGCERLIDAIATERTQWDKCTRELGEKPFANYIRTMNFKRNLAMVARFGLVVEEFEFIVAHRSELKLSKVKEWKLIEKLFIEAAVVAARVGVDDTAYEDSASNGSVEAKPAVHAIRPLDKAIGGQSGHRPIGGPTQEEIEATKKRLKDSGKDIETQCIECDQKFTHTINKQIEFAGKGWNKTPRKCPGCTDKQNKSRMCFDYMKGQCRHADLCRFSHHSDTPVVQHTSTNLEESSSSEEYGDY